MTSPDRITPSLDGSADAESSQLAKLFANGLASPQGGVISNVVSGLKNVFTGVAAVGFEQVASAWNSTKSSIDSSIGSVNGRVDEVVRSQAELEAQLRLDMEALAGVPGYIHVTMSKSVNVRNGDNNNISLPFDWQVGIAKGAQLSTNVGRPPVSNGTNGAAAVLTSPGLWMIYCSAMTRYTAALKGLNDPDTSRLELNAVCANPDDYTQGSSTTYYSEVYNSNTPATLHCIGSVQVPESQQCIIWVKGWSARWRYFEGGLGKATLICVKHDNRPGALDAPINVPDA